MGSPGLFEECQNVIKKGNESWKSFLTKWEALAKYEDEVPEEEVFNKLSDKPKFLKRKVNKQSSKTAGKSLPLGKLKENVRKCRKLVRKRKGFGGKKETKEKNIVKTKESNEQVSREMETEEVEKVLNSVFVEFSRQNQSEVFLFSALSQTFSNLDGTDSYNFSVNKQESILSNDFQSKVGCSKENKKIVPEVKFKLVFNQNRVNHKESPISNVDPYECYFKSSGFKQIIKKVVCDSTPSKTFHPNFMSDELSLFDGDSISLGQRDKVNLYKITSPGFLSSLKNPKRNPLEWDLPHKSLATTCRKINKEDFIKREPLIKTNIFEDSKRFRKFYSHKRTNSFTLSIENTNLTTPERKPPERKCFSENVLKRKRNEPSKLYFDEIVDDSDDNESNEQNETMTPIIFSQKNKFKKLEITKNDENSDSDESESIFDRVKF